MMQDTREKLSPVSIGLHWVVGVTIIAMVAFGMIIADLPKSNPDKASLLALHKSIGMIVLVFAAWRLWRRIRLGLPRPVGRYSVVVERLSKSVHVFLLFATLALPLSGLLSSIGSGRPVSVFGIPVVPVLLAQKNEILATAARGTHDIMGKLLLLAVALHVAGALKHHVLDHDGTLRRMLGARVTPVGPV